jgi:uncharacterized protein YbaP (TraB family)
MRRRIDDPVSKRHIIRIRPFLLFLFAWALIAFGCSSQHQARSVSDAEQTPLFLWKVTHPNVGPGTVYLLGTIHIRAETDSSIDGAIVEAFSRSDALVVEADVTSAKEQALIELIQTIGLLKKGDSLSNHISKETYDRLQATLNSFGLSERMLDPMQPWLANMVLVLADNELRGYSAHYGVDRYLINHAETQQIPIEFLETLEEQIQIFAGCTPEVQEFLLLETLNNLHEDSGNATMLQRAYQHGDDKQMEKLIFSKMMDQPKVSAFLEALFFDRNDKMIPKIKRMCAQTGTRLVAVGAGHLVGEKGLVRRLQGEGCILERIMAQGGADSKSASQIVRQAEHEPLWHTTRDSQMGFSIQFPSKPTFQKQVVPSKGGEMLNHKYMVTGITMHFIVDVVSFPDHLEGWVDTMTSKILERGVTEWAMKTGGEVREQKTMDLMGHPATSVKIAIDGGTAEGFFVLAHGKFFHIQAVRLGESKIEEKRTKSINRFLSSLTILNP